MHQPDIQHFSPVKSSCLMLKPHEKSPIFPGGSWIVGRAPWPVTVVLRLLSANAKTVRRVKVCNGGKLRELG